MKEKFLPIGTVLLLKGATKRLMITGYCSATQESQNIVYDYVACLFPEGNLAGDEVALFNHTQIETIVHMGLVDDEFNNINKEIKKLVEEGSNSTIEQAVLTPLTQNDINSIIGQVGGLDQVLEPTPFNEEIVKRPLFSTSLTEDNKDEESNNVNDSLEESKAVVEETINDGQPVLQLQPIYSDSSVSPGNSESSTPSSTTVSELTRL